MIINRNGESVEIPDEDFYAEYPECRPGQEQPPELTDIDKIKARLDATENAVLFLMDMGGI